MVSQKELLDVVDALATRAEEVAATLKDKVCKQDYKDVDKDDLELINLLDQLAYKCCQTSEQVKNKPTSLFSLEEVTYEQLILRVNSSSALDIARHPYIERDWLFLTLTRGEGHILTATLNSGGTKEWAWGTFDNLTKRLAGSNAARLARSVSTFALDNHVLIDLTSPVCECDICFNKIDDKWHIRFNDENENSQYVYLSDKYSLADVRDFVEPFFDVNNVVVSEQKIEIHNASTHRDHLTLNLTKKEN